MTGACNSPESAISYEGSYVVIETFHQGSGGLKISEFSCYGMEKYSSNSSRIAIRLALHVLDQKSPNLVVFLRPERDSFPNRFFLSCRASDPARGLRDNLLTVKHGGVALAEEFGGVSAALPRQFRFM
jgi:hypothetical protein